MLNAISYFNVSHCIEIILYPDGRSINQYTFSQNDSFWYTGFQTSNDIQNLLSQYDC